eukprot:gene16570-16385_t
MIAAKPTSFQGLILTLHNYWSDHGCVILQPHDIEVGAGTLHPATVLRALGPKPWNAAYVQPSRRPGDGRYGENPNRLQHYYQYQVLLKPNPPDMQDQYLGSLAAIGLDARLHDIRFVEDDWENPTVGAWGLGWEVWCDGMEVSQYTYMQQVGGLDVNPVAGELTYGLERLAMYVFGVDNVYDLPFNDRGMSYGEVFLENERQQSAYNFEVADVETLKRQFEDMERQVVRILDEGVGPQGQKLVLPAYDHVLKASHLFNVMNARGAIAVAERASYIGRIRDLCRMKPLALLIAAALLAAPLPAFAQSEDPNNVVQVAQDDVEMNAARERARQSLPGFWTRFDNDAEVRETAVLKLRFPAKDGGLEVMWVRELVRKDGVVTGVLDNEPIMDVGVQPDQRFTLDLSQVVDWGYYRGDKRWGFFTTRLLLELFSEEIPARMQAQAARDLERMVRDGLSAAGLITEGMKAFAGPRRLALVIEGLPIAQADRDEEVKGPRVGSPDQAIDGFLRKTGLTREQLSEQGGTDGRATTEIIAELVEQTVRNFPWPKSMTWGSGKLRWVRPLQRILCVFDREV